MSIAKIIVRVIIGIFEVAIAIVEGATRTLAGCLAVVRVQLHKEYDYRCWLKRDLSDCKTILELGCGANSPILQIGYGLKTTALDIWEPYIDAHNRAGHYHKALVRDIMDYEYPEKLFDAVVVTDVLEHLDRDQVLDQSLFTKLARVARKKVIIFTPNGKTSNDISDGNIYQNHNSVWEPIDFIRQGYKVVGATGLRYILDKSSLPKYHPYSIFAIIAMLSQPIIYHNPEIAFHSYAVREV